MRMSCFVFCCLAAVLGLAGEVHAQSSLPVRGPETEPGAEEKPAEEAGALRLSPETGASPPPSRFEAFRRRYRIAASGTQLHLLDPAGRRMDTAHLPSDVVDALLGDERIYAATRADGILVFRVNWAGRLEKAGKLEVEGHVSRLYYDHPYLFVLRPRRQNLLYRLSGSGALPIRDGRWHREPPAAPQDRREKASGRVVRIHGGEVTVSLGSVHGFKPGDRIRVLSQGRKPQYDPIDGVQRQDSRLKLRAILTLDEVREDDSSARMERGLDIREGDLVQYFGEEKTPEVERVLRWGGTSRVIANVLPGFLVGDPMLGLQVRFEHQFDFPLTLGVGLRTLAGSEVSGIGIIADAAYDTDYFAIGYQADFLKLSGEEEGGIPFLGTSGMFIRLGTLDGLHLLFTYRSNFQDLYGLSGRVQLSGNRHNLYASWDVTFGTYKTIQSEYYEENQDMTLGSVLLGDRIRLWGNGGHDTLFASIYLGMQFADLDADENASFVMGGGVEYRF